LEQGKVVNNRGAWSSGWLGALVEEVVAEQVKMRIALIVGCVS